MTIRASSTVTLFRNALLFVALAVSGVAAGCGAPEELDEADQMTAETDEQSLARGGGGRRLSYSCTSSGSCTCDKSIENDCEDMSAVCTDDTVDTLINCINGWLTTHCTCTKAKTAAPSPSPYTVPLGTVKTLTAR